MYQADGPGEAVDRTASPGDRLVRDIRELAVQEAARFRGDLAESLRRAGVGAVLLAGAGVAVVLGLGSASAAVLSLAESDRTPRRAALLLAAGYLGTGVLLTVVGLTRLSAAGGRTSRLSAELRNLLAAVRTARR
ncbi:phage holin family protein [Plantactinospora sp. CA-294935]|uniref:phage holin family protein n=1 Tax=Plantactinospora sp. CA-294935 TaxID=3240012 RepID=UPI003D928C28